MNPKENMCGKNEKINKNFEKMRDEAWEEYNKKRKAMINLSNEQSIPIPIVKKMSSELVFSKKKLEYFDNMILTPPFLSPVEILHSNIKKSLSNHNLKTNLV